MKAKAKAKTRVKSVGAELLESMREATAHARGEPTGTVVHRFDPTDVKAVRQRLGMSQMRFAALLSTPLPTLRKWEQGQRLPSGAARALLRIIEREPVAALRALELR